MSLRFIIFLFSISMLFSCQMIIRHHLGIKNPDIEKQKTITSLIEKHKIDTTFFLKKDKIADSYIGEFPKIYVFNRQGYQVIIPNCYEMIAENINGLVDTIPNKLSNQSFRDKFVQETIYLEKENLLPGGQYDYEVFFYWSVWLGKWNVKKLKLAQETINGINQRQSQLKLHLIPLNFDFIEESGWTEQSAEEALKAISKSKLKEKS